MATMMTLVGANFSGRGLPNIKPFVAEVDLAYAYDFRDGDLLDYTSQTTLLPKINDIVGNQKMVTNYGIVKTTDDGLGIVVSNGCLELSEELTPVQLGGSEQFTIMVIGGYSGEIFPSDDVAISTPTICSLFDYGTGISASGFSLEAYQSDIGARIEHGSMLMKNSIPNKVQPCCMFLTFDGGRWSLHNMTIGNVMVKTNAELDISTNPLVVSSVGSNKVKLGGHYHATSTLGALAPALYQSAKWNRVLTEAEIAEQYSRARATFGVVGI